MGFGALRRYARWLHTQWPAGRVEKLPVVGPDGETGVPGLRIAGDLTGIPLLKFSSDTGARAVRAIAEESSFRSRTARDGVVDLAIVGGGVAGMAAALEAKQRGLSFEVLEAAEAFSTVVNFPKRKPIYTYPTDMTPYGPLQFGERSSVKEGLVEELRETVSKAGIEPRRVRVGQVVRRDGLFELILSEGGPVRAHRVIVAIGRSGNFRRLGVPGEELDKVSNRLHDPADFEGQDVLVVGGGDSALETAIALAESGARVTLSYRGGELTRPKPENAAAARALAERSDDGGGSLRLALESRVESIREGEVVLRHGGGESETLANDAVFTMIGREPPLDFLRRAGIAISGDLGVRGWMAMSAFLLFSGWLFHWKASKAIPLFGRLPAWLDPRPAAWWNALEATGGALAAALADPATLLGTLRLSASGPAFYYTLAYSLLVVVFGIRRIRRRRTPYVAVQTWTLMAVQCLPLFLLPELILPWLGHNGWLDAGAPGWIADQLFPAVSYGHGREYWRAYGLILAFPLNVYNWYTSQPLWGWLLLGGIQTFVLIPLVIYYWGKGAYCGWICSCGALAETLGDAHRHKMPHGPGWNRLDLLGQGILAIAFGLMALRVGGWIWPGSWADRAFAWGFGGAPVVNYAWFVDIFLAGILGYGLYFWFSGRTWCRWACPLAALMHVYTRFSRFRILAEKKKCISCNVCTSVCHQGIDVMSFANRGLPMADPECVRCSACVQSCPTGVLSFGQIDPRSGRVLGSDPAWLAASPVRAAEAE